jgi:hypothetical protein
MYMITKYCFLQNAASMLTNEITGNTKTVHWLDPLRLAST